MNIVFITTGLARGGAEMQLVQLALRHKARGHNISVVSMLPPLALHDELAAAKIPLLCLNMTRGLPNPLAVFRLARLIRRLRPDVVHAHMVHANLLARVTRLICRMPVLVCTAHNVYEISTREKVIKEYSFRDFLYRITDFLADVTTQICQAGADRYLRVGSTSPRRMRIIYNGVDVNRFTPSTYVRAEKRRELGLEQQWTWLAVGRFEVAKDYPNLAQAFAIFLRSSPKDLLLIAGDGPMRLTVEEQCRALGLNGSVKFLGLRNDVAELMQAADAFVISSMFEGLPMVLIEAHCSGLPIVATRVGGNPEVVIEGGSGFLCEARNPAALADAMLRLRYQSNESLASIKLRGRAQICEHFALDRVVAQWEKLYCELSGNTTTLK